MRVFVNMDALELKKIRQDAGLSQEQMARKLGLSMRTIQKYEKGDIIPISVQKAVLYEFGEGSKGIDVAEDPRATYGKLSDKDELILSLKKQVKLLEGQVSSLEGQLATRNKQGKRIKQLEIETEEIQMELKVIQGYLNVTEKLEEIREKMKEEGLKA